MIRLLLGALLGLGGFAAAAFAELQLRALERGAIVNAGGVATALVGEWWLWGVGLVLLVAALPVVLAVRRLPGTSWLAAGVVVAALLVIGSLLGVARGLGAEQAPAGFPAALLIAGASSALAWVFAGVALALAGLRRGVRRDVRNVQSGSDRRRSRPG